MKSLLPGVPILPHETLLQATLDLRDEGFGNVTAMVVAEAASSGPPLNTPPGVAALPDQRREDKIEKLLSTVLAECNASHGVLLLESCQLSKPKENTCQTHTKNRTRILLKRRAQNFISSDKATMSQTLHLRHARRRSRVTFAARSWSIFCLVRMI